MRAPDREQRLSRAFVALADTMVDDYDVIDLLDQLVDHSTALLAAEAAGLLLGDARGNLRVVAASGEDAELIELLQLQADQGPSLDCYRTGRSVSVPDLAEAPLRWPDFAAAAARVGVFRSVHALPLRLRGQTIGTLNLFHREPGPLPEADLALGQALADVATIGILQERAVRRSEVLTEHLQVALNNRMIIEQAKGVIAQHLGVGVHTGFEILRAHARQGDRRLVEVARALVTGELGPSALRAAQPAGGHRGA